ncbi:MAG: recombinase family protein [Ruminococcus sp.]|jgi:site-specific DNA recombinase
MKTAAAYIRVSTEDQLEYSPDSQLKKIREYSRQRDIFLPDEFVFCDEGISGRYAGKRPGFMKMIETAKKNPRPFEVILVWKFSRFARSRQDSIFYKSMLRKECGIDVVSVTEQIGSDPTAILIEALLEAMDEYYSINLGQEVKRGMNEKFSRGGIVSVPPFGYVAREGTFMAEEKKAGAVRMIYEDFLKGASMREISLKLNELGIRTNRNNPFKPRAVAYILSNPVYAGHMRRKTGKPGCMQWSLSKGEYQPLITEEMFQMVQERLKKLKKEYPAHTSFAKKTFMLQGLVRCSCCKSTLTQTVRGKALQCCRYSRGECQESHYISLKRINDAVCRQILRDLGEKTEDAGSAVSRKMEIKTVLELFSKDMVGENEKNRILRSIISEITFWRKEGNIRIRYRV